MAGELTSKPQEVRIIYLDEVEHADVQRPAVTFAEGTNGCSSSRGRSQSRSRPGGRSRSASRPPHYRYGQRQSTSMDSQRAMESWCSQRISLSVNADSRLDMAEASARVQDNTVESNDTSRCVYTKDTLLQHKPPVSNKPPEELANLELANLGDVPVERQPGRELRAARKSSDFPLGTIKPLVPLGARIDDLLNQLTDDTFESIAEQLDM
mmetsp:Transcript_46671/g.116295  ORF Transcript_46671/g.116295 Transcript_46671/m.116295 type:complete len:210 (+) Transcript_46671:553-1182(+)